MSRPPKPRKLKAIAGTLQPCRDLVELPPLPASRELPPPPEWLPNSHALREYERLGRAMVTYGLLHEGNVGALAMLAAVHGKLVQSLAAGAPLPAALISQYRGLAGDLRLTALVRAPKGDERPPNRFASNGSRPQQGGLSQ